LKWGLVVGAAALILRLLRPVLDRRYRARWRTWTWLILACALILGPGAERLLAARPVFSTPPVVIQVPQMDVQWQADRDAGVRLPGPPSGPPPSAPPPPGWEGGGPGGGPPFGRCRRKPPPRAGGQNGNLQHSRDKNWERASGPFSQFFAQCSFSGAGEQAFLTTDPQPVVFQIYSFYLICRDQISPVRADKWFSQLHF